MDVMVDLETYGTRGHALILVIAAIKFERNGRVNSDLSDLKEEDLFYERISIPSCQRIGMHIDEKTVQWWKEQKEEIQNEVIYAEPRSDIKQALIRFTKWFGLSTYIWSHGASFDIPILTEAYKRCNLVEPWKFRNIRDTRTIYDLAGLDVRELPKTNLHDARYDCLRQIWGVNESMYRLGLN